MEELFDIYDEEMQLQGTASRSDTHTYGYWHQTIHCWLWREEQGRRFIWFQRRHHGKDLYPDYLDITAAGHLSAGETVRDAAREIEEEIGIAAPFNTLVKVGVQRESLISAIDGVPFIDRELAHVFSLKCPLPLSALRPHPEEVAGVFEAELERLLQLFEGKLGSLIGHGVEFGQGGQFHAASRVIEAAHFVPRDVSYYVRILRAIQQLS
ncbi:NUDIX domain-containing protein [Paenibacillaceae bacterium]|nr:NUDIX domain-containing protein [Paenibacillaceae bacterium]